jgi:hypothetical protein
LAVAGLAESSAQVAQILFYIFIVSFLVSLIVGFARRTPPSGSVLRVNRTLPNGDNASDCRCAARMGST